MGDLIELARLKNTSVSIIPTPFEHRSN